LDNPRAWPCRAPFRGPATSAGELFKQGRPKEAIDAQLQEVKAQPGNHGKRLFLFELASFAGDPERARRQIEAVQYPEPELQMAVQGYRKLLDAEDRRRRLFRDGLAPTSPGSRLEGWKSTSSGNRPRGVGAEFHFEQPGSGTGVILPFLGIFLTMVVERVYMFTGRG
jgi:hypothetical protein